jgi:hypothetical protein
MSDSRHLLCVRMATRRRSSARASDAATPCHPPPPAICRRPPSVAPSTIALSSSGHRTRTLALLLAGRTCSASTPALLPAGRTYSASTPVLLPARLTSASKPAAPTTSMPPLSPFHHHASLGFRHREPLELEGLVCSSSSSRCCSETVCAC